METVDVTAPFKQNLGRPMSDKQIQKAGDSSLQIQADTVNNYVTIIGTPETQAPEMDRGNETNISDSTVYQEETQVIGDKTSTVRQLSDSRQNKYGLLEGNVPTLVFCIEANGKVIPPKTATLLNLIADDNFKCIVKIEDAYLNQLKRNIAELSSIPNLTSAQEAQLANLMTECKSRDKEIRIRTYALELFINSRNLWFDALLTTTPTPSKLVGYLDSFISQGWFGSLQKYADNSDYRIVDCYNNHIDFKMPISKKNISEALESNAIQYFHRFTVRDSLPPIRDYFSLIDFNSSVRSDAVAWLCYTIAYNVIVLKKNYEVSNNTTNNILNLLSYYCGPA